MKKNEKNYQIEIEKKWNKKRTEVEKRSTK